jgi:hypothetical protein
MVDHISKRAVEVQDRPRYIDCAVSIQVVGVNVDRSSRSKRWFKDKTVYSSHRLLTFSTNPSGRHLQPMSGMESIMERSLSSKGAMLAALVSTRSPADISPYLPEYLVMALLKSSAKARYAGELQNERHLVSDNPL